VKSRLHYLKRGKLVAILPNMSDEAKLAPHQITHLVRILGLTGFEYCSILESEPLGVKLPDKDREGQPIIFDSYDMSPVLLGTGKCERSTWFYFTENELSPGAVRAGN
jgi:hypothetical protein